MSNQPLCASLAALLAATLFSAAVRADSHREQAWRQASEAANSPGDSKAIAEHANEALKHIEAAKAETKDPNVARHLHRSETELKSAIKNAESFNADAAVRDAKDAANHLEETFKP